MEINEEKRQKFIEYAGKRVNNILHDIQVLEPMSRSNSYDFTKQDLEEMFTAMQECLDSTKEEFYKKFEEKARAEKKVFSFGMGSSTKKVEGMIDENVSNNEEVGQELKLENAEKVEDDVSSLEVEEMPF